MPGFIEQSPAAAIAQTKLRFTRSHQYVQIYLSSPRFGDSRPDYFGTELKSQADAEKRLTDYEGCDELARSLVSSSLEQAQFAVHIAACKSAREIE